MMETNQMTKKILDFQRGAFSSWYSVMAAMQEQAASSMNTVLDQSDWLPEEGRRMVRSWIGACKKGCDEYKGLVEESISGIEKVLVVPAKRTAGAKKTVVKVKATAPAKPKEMAAVAAQTASTPAQKPAIEAKPAVDATDGKAKTSQ